MENTIVLIIIIIAVSLIWFSLLKKHDLCVCGPGGGGGGGVCMGISIFLLPSNIQETGFDSYFSS